MPCRSRAHKLSLFRLPGTSSVRRASLPCSFPVPFWRSPNPPSAAAHPWHPPSQGACRYSTSPRYRYAPLGIGASWGSCRISPCCCSRYGGRREWCDTVHIAGAARAGLPALSIVAAEPPSASACIAGTA